jgi:TRAP-type C4-dicarboxylate transport system permease small subunit
MKQGKLSFSSVVKGIDTVLCRLLAIILAAMTGIIFTQVFSRYILNYSFSWSEEVSRYLFLWLIFAGLPTLIYRNAMTAFDMVIKKLSGMSKKAAAALIAIGNLSFLVLLTMGSIPLVQRQFSQMATSIPIPIGLVYMIMPISGVLSIIVTIERLFASVITPEKAV